VLGGADRESTSAGPCCPDLRSQFRQPCSVPSTANTRQYRSDISAPQLSQAFIDSLILSPQQHVFFGYPPLLSTRWPLCLQSQSTAWAALISRSYHLCGAILRPSTGRTQRVIESFTAEQCIPLPAPYIYISLKLYSICYARYRGCMQQTDVPVSTVSEQESVVAELPYLDCKYDLIVQNDAQGSTGVIPLLCL